jgi:hypothetical protein
LLEGYEGEEREQYIRLDPRIVLLFDRYSIINEKILGEIKGPVQKIYGYLAGIPHSELYPISIRNIFEACYGVTEYLIRNAMPKNEEILEGDARAIAERSAERLVAKKYSDFRRKNLEKALVELRDKYHVISSFCINQKEEKVTITKVEVNDH